MGKVSQLRVAGLHSENDFFDCEIHKLMWRHFAIHNRDIRHKVIETIIDSVRLQPG
jgi:hypothetical protein